MDYFLHDFPRQYYSEPGRECNGVAERLFTAVAVNSNHACGTEPKNKRWSFLEWIVERIGSQQPNSETAGSEPTSAAGSSAAGSVVASNGSGKPNGKADAGHTQVLHAAGVGADYSMIPPRCSSGSA
jgi:hypothetical protein